MNKPTLERTARALGMAAVIGQGAMSTANAQDFFLCAGETTKTMPDTGEVITLWGFAQDDNDDLSDGCGTGAVSVPGPQLAVDAGGTLTLHVLNDLPQLDGGDTPLSIVVPGQIAPPNPTWIDAGGTVVATGSRPAGDYSSRVRSFATETTRGSVGTYSWSGLKPGTFLYQSGTHPALQVQMGLYGALTVAAGENLAYPGVPYDEEVVLLYSELDPVLHAAVAANDYGPGGSFSSTLDYRPRYFLVNGEPHSAGSSPITLGSSGNKVLLRFLNAGLESHTLVLQDMYLSLHAEDGNPVPHAQYQYSVFLPPGKTRDASLALDCSRPPAAGRRALYDRQLSLSNGGAATTGGMLSYLDLSDSDTDSVASICDNCTLVANGDQRDSDGDGYGNRCDTDLNNDGVTNTLDVGILRSVFLSDDADADFNGDGVVNTLDVGILSSYFLQPPGPSSVAP